ncbi:MAG: sugar phosphate isomerase/epimerase [Treponema sp.]|jgi:sugar phosphate isomerase/epimerase|nr:sugar phosphate isomerase/epimerase [Treponema sp.]
MSNEIVKKHDLSIILFTVASSPLPYGEKLKKLREIGYQSVQSGIHEGLDDQDHKKMLDDLDMEMSCLGGGLGAIQDNPSRVIKAAHIFECDEVMLGTMPTENRADYDGYMRAIDMINAAAKVFIKEGIYLSYHNHAQEFRRFSNGKRGIDLLFENFDPTAVRFLLDTHWLQSGGADILEWMEKCRGRIKNLHVKDYRIAPANYETGIGETNKQFSQIGDGNLPWPLIIEKGREIGIRTYIVEQDRSYGEDPFDCAAQSFKTLKALGLK